MTEAPTGTREEAPGAPDLRPAGWLVLVLLAAAFAVPASAAAGLFMVLVRVLTEVAWERVPAALAIPEPLVLVGVPVAASLVVGLVIRFAPGHGGPDPSTEHGLGGQPGTMRELPGTVAAAAASLASGASVGPEAPLLGILGTLGHGAAAALRLPREAGMMLGFAGFAAVLGGIFGNPLAVGLLLLETSPMVGRDLYRRIIPGLVASTVGVLVFSAVAGEPYTDFQFPAYPTLEPWHLLAAVGIGLGGGIVGIGYLHLVRLIRGILEPVGELAVTRALIGGALVGAVALVFGELTLFSGEHELDVVVAEGEAMGLAAVLFLAVGKILAGAVSLSSGFRGGRIFPVLFIGGTLGMALHVGLPWIPVALAVPCGMAATGISLFRYPLFLVALIVVFTTPDAIPPMVLAAVAAWTVVERQPEL